MYNKSLITIEEKTICGIKNPLLIIKGKDENENSKFIVYEDDKEIEYELSNIGNNDFILKTELSSKSKKIELFLIINNEKYFICKLNNSLLNRITIKCFSFIRIILTKIKVLFIVIYKGIKFLWKEHHFLVPISLWKKYINAFKDRIKNSGIDLFYQPFRQDEYLNWLKENEKEEIYEKQKYEPLISVLIPVYNIDSKFLTECLDSILNQSYQNFEICIVDDCSTNEETIETLKKYQKNEKIFVKFHKKNEHISKTTNDALKMANGEFIALVDNDDVLSSDAFYQVVKALNKDKEIDFIYSDEDKLDLKGIRRDPNFKPDYSPDTLMSMNYICHLSVIRKKLVEQVGGFEIGLEGAQDYDLFLKITEKTSKIYHIPKILYHWRMVEGSTSMTIENKGYAKDKGKIALENALKRRNISGIVEKDVKTSYYKIRYTYDKEPKISIIIPTRDYASTLDTCLKSIYDKTTYKNYEVIVANNNSVEKETFDLFDKYKKSYNNFKVIDINTEFNYSYINNECVKQAKGKYIVLLNNDTEIITNEWLEIMVGYAMQNHIGAVGPKLLYPDTTVQHGGVILGLGGVASHAYIGSSKDDPGMYGRLSVPYNYSAVTAACLMVDKKKFEEVGGLEETLKVAYNDIDFNIKLLKKGYYNVFVPQVQLIHFESKSRGLDTTSEKYKRFLEESKYMFDKWGLEYDSFYNENFSKKGWFVLDKQVDDGKNKRNDKK